MPPNVSYIQQTPIFNFNDSSVTSVEFQDHMTQLTQAFNNMALVVNQKDTGFYDTIEFVNSQFWYPTTASQGQFRPGLRTTYPFALQDFTINPVQNIAHELTLETNFQFTRIFGAANIPGFAAIPLPYVNLTAANSIQLDIDSTNIVLRSNADYSAYTDCEIVLEYCY